ncbi:sensor histidine kinase [Spirosoma sp. KNUC1025]|uniref:sensor histidine kinase n=1 Tax=Spirosoma sp. KNUC1025 TaxID=2894082 RepID=UPI00386F7BE8|nr:histidine kinase [Spirosoma sp. KNUC1025]
MRASLTMLFLMLTIPVWSQTARIDRLRQALPELEGRARVDGLNALGREFTFYYVHADSALKYARLAYRQAVPNAYLRGQAVALLTQGDVAGRLLADFKLMVHRSEQVIALLKNQNEPVTLSKAYYLLAIALGSQGQYEQGLRAALNARQYALAARDRAALGWAIQAAGYQYCKRGQYWKGFENLIQSQKIGKEIKDSALTAVSLAFIGRSFNRVGDPQKALAYYYQFLPYATPFLLLFPQLEDMAYAHLQLRNYDSVLYYQQKHQHNLAILTTDEAVRKKFRAYVWGFSVEVQLARHQYDQVLADVLPLMDNLRRKRDVMPLMQSLLTLAKVYEGKQNYPTAMRYARELRQTALQTANQQYLKDANGLMATLFEQVKRPDSAYGYFKQYTALNDSLAALQFAQRTALYLAASQAENRIRLLKQDKALKEQQLVVKQQELQRQSQSTNMLAGGLLGLLVCSLLVFRTMTLKRKNEVLRHEQAQSSLKRKALELEMQALRTQMNPHFIFNCLSAIDNLIQTGQPDKATTYLARFAKLIRLVLDSSKNNLVHFQKDFDTLRLYLELEQFRCNHKFSYSLTAAPELIAGDYQVPPLIIQPFVENAIHHGLLNKPDNCRQLDIAAWLKDEYIIYSVIDNGIGRAQAARLKELNRPEHQSYGIQITRERIQLHNRHHRLADVQISDLEEDGRPAGTKAVVRINSAEPYMPC